MDNTKAVHINTKEIKCLMRYYGNQIQMHDEFAADENIERLRYLNKRLKDYTDEKQEVKSSW